MPVAEPTQPAAFPTTMWSRVLRTRDDAQSRAALDELCDAYWQSALSFVRMLGCGADAEDVTQDFFATFLRLDGFQRAEPDRGRLRGYLKTAIRHHVAHWWRDRATLRRGGGAEPLELTMDLPAPPEADTRYDEEWALTVLDRALTKLRESYAARGRADVYEQLKPTLLGAAQVERSLAVEQHRARRRLAEFLRREVADTVDDPAEVDAELLHLLRVLTQ